MLCAHLTRRSKFKMRTIAAMEHVNLTIPDQALGALFYVSTMGFTRDPYLDFDDWNMWINVGREQFHTPKGEAQMFRGEIGIRVPGLDGLERRLARLAGRFEGTEFNFARDGATMRVTCPWGNRFTCREALPNEYPLAIEELIMQVPEASLGAIAGTYETLLETSVERQGTGVTVPTGPSQRLRFIVGNESPAAYDGHHIAIYIENYGEARQRAVDAGVLSAEREPHEFRFIEFRDARTGEAAWALEHEVRSTKHPMFGRDLVNRNPANTLFHYQRGSETLVSLHADTD